MNNMAGMNAMGGPVGGGMPMMNNGGAAGGRQPMPVTGSDQRERLNTYIYEYFLRNGMFDCARSLLNSDQPINTLKDSPGRHQEDSADGDSKEDIDSKRPDDLPLPNLPKETPESCFLYEWWCVFWDMFNAQRGKTDSTGRQVANYISHTQAQNRSRQEQQAAMLRGIKSDMGGLPQNYQQMMMRGQNGLNMQQNELRQKAIQNNRNGTPQQQQQQQMQMQMLQAQQQKQQQMQRDPSEGNGQQRPQSPGSAENAPSPTKRPRLEGPFNNQMPNGRGQSQGMPQQVGETGPSNAIQAAHLQLTNGIEPNNLTGQQFQNMPGGTNAMAQQSRVAGYQASLSQQQAGQMPGKPGGMPGQPGGPQNQGSPMMTQGQDGSSIANYYNPTELGPNGMRGGPNQANGGGNHALQDYQMQLMLLEQQNKKRLMMARQEQDNMTVPRADGAGGPGGPGMGPNGQPFQGTSPQGPRSVNSPNPSEQMKRGTPHMNPAGIPSPVPEGMDPNMDPKFYQMNGMNPNMVPGGMPNGMRPPSSHPGGGFGNQIAQQQMAMAARQQAGQNWQGGPNGQMVPGPNQGAPQQNMGTPRQGAMPPPSAPTAANGNGRTQPSSPQQTPAAPPTPSQGNKANPKKKNESKAEKAKRATKKGSAANLNAGATPSADAPTDGPTPTPQTPITPVHPSSFQKNQQNGVQPATNGQSAAGVNNGVPAQQPDINFDMSGQFDQFQPLSDFAPNNAMGDVLQDFDFDSFLHQDGDVGDNFNFDTSGFLDDGGQLATE